MSLRSAFAPAEQRESNAQITARGKRAVVLGALAVTVLNPHLYLDTVVILGSIGGQYEGQDRIAFAIGTVLASFAWFYSLSLGAAKLGPTLSKPKVKKGIDIGVLAMMFTIAIILANGLWQQYM